MWRFGEAAFSRIRRANDDVPRPMIPPSVAAPIQNIRLDVVMLPTYYASMIVASRYHNHGGYHAEQSKPDDGVFALSQFAPSRPSRKARLRPPMAMGMALFRVWQCG